VIRMKDKGERSGKPARHIFSHMTNERLPAKRERAAVRLERQWQELCSQYLPVTPAGSLWRYHLVHSRDQPSNGWKLHVSATVLNAGRALRKVAPLLASRGVQFKAPASLGGVIRLNSGLSHGYTQVGKVITVYPHTADDMVRLAGSLHKLTVRMAAPRVPFDRRYSRNSNVYYRFGAFQHLEIEQPDGSRTLAVQGPNGKLVPDNREQATPDWVTDPFAGHRQRFYHQSERQLLSTYRIFRALAQRGKGGVYQALDLNVNPPRLCLIKEGRKYGELTWDGRDGRWRIRNEARVLGDLLARGVNVPRVYSSFDFDGNSYLVTEFVDGESLENLLRRLRIRMPVSRVLKYGIQLASFFSQMHAAGWVWRDCKPMNIIVTPNDDLKPLDFEGASRVGRPDTMLWGTPGFIPPEWREIERQTGLPDDLFALGSILYLLVTGRVPEMLNAVSPKAFRRNIPDRLSALIMSLLSADPKCRPQAMEALDRLNELAEEFPSRSVPPYTERRRPNSAQLDESLRLLTSSTNLGSERIES
jgi:serine/threonine protein kinase